MLVLTTVITISWQLLQPEVEILESLRPFSSVMEKSVHIFDAFHCHGRNSICFYAFAMRGKSRGASEGCFKY